MLLPLMDEVECFARGEIVEIGGADFVEEWVLFEAEESELPRVGTRLVGGRLLWLGDFLRYAASGFGGLMLGL